jgi:cytochrome oxidase assembly protein ShyY1
MNLQAEPRRRGIVVPIIFVLVTCAALASLGTWQLERKSWKEGLIAELESKLSAQPIALPPRDRWPQLAAATDEFRRVKFPAEFLDQEALVYPSGSSLRPDVSGPGYWVLSPARLSEGNLVIVNRGFVPEGKQDPGRRKEGRPSGIVEIVGVMRWPEQHGQFTPADEPQKGLWFARDPAAMAKAKNWGNVAPFYIDQEAPVPAGGVPRPAPLKVNLRNEHLQYAVVWFGLALVLAGSFGFWVFGRQRELSASRTQSH